MKRKGSKSDYTDARNKELRKAFFSQDAYSTSDRALEKVLKTPTSRFWVDPDHARDTISRIKRNPEILERMLPERQRMYTELIRKFDELKMKYPGSSNVNCVTMAIYSGAPEFYIKPSTARAILYNS